jgi:hypothetical protein
MLAAGMSEAPTLVSAAVAVVLVLGALAKLRALEAFCLICSAYPGAAQLGVSTIAYGAVAAELVCGTLVLLPDRALNRAGLFASCTFIAATTVAVALRWRRGEKRFQCGCGTDLDAETSPQAILGRNIVAAVALITAACGTVVERRVDPTDWLACMLAAAGLVALWHLIAAARLTWMRIHEWPAPG